MFRHIPMWIQLLLWEHFLGLCSISKPKGTHTRNVYIIYSSNTLYSTSHYCKSNYWLFSCWTTKHHFQMICKAWQKTTRARKFKVNAKIALVHFTASSYACLRRSKYHCVQWDLLWSKPWSCLSRTVWTWSINIFAWNYFSCVEDDHLQSSLTAEDILLKGLSEMASGCDYTSARPGVAYLLEPSPNAVIPRNMHLLVSWLFTRCMTHTQASVTSLETGEIILMRLAQCQKWCKSSRIHCTAS